MTEQWRGIPGFEGRYEVSDLGRVRSWVMGGFAAGLRDRPYIRKPQVGKNGYLIINLTGADGVHMLTTVHRIVLAAFVGPAPEGMVACHNDGDHTNNSASNLRWDTQAANIADKTRHGTMLRGEALHHSKLTEAQVLEIDRLISMGAKNTHIAKQYGVVHTTISAIKKGDNWAWLTGREGKE